MWIHPEHNKYLLYHFSQGSYFKLISLFFTLTKLVSSNPPFPSSAFSTGADGFLSEEESQDFSCMSSNTEEGVDCWFPRRGTGGYIWNVPAEHMWAHRTEGTWSVRGAAECHPLKERRLYCNNSLEQEVEVKWGYFKEHNRICKQIISFLLLSKITWDLTFGTWVNIPWTIWISQSTFFFII